jgi:hypothetical protein
LRVIAVQGLLAMAADCRFALVDGVGVIDDGALSFGVSALTAGFFGRGRLGRCAFDGGWIGRGRLGGVGRILIEPCFEFGEALLVLLNQGQDSRLSSQRAGFVARVRQGLAGLPSCSWTIDQATTWQPRPVNQYKRSYGKDQLISVRIHAMDNEFVINEELLHAIEGTTLFYPCSGEDLVVPLRNFAPTVSEFWFVDVAYFRNDVAYYWKGQPADQVKPVLSTGDGYELIEKTIDGPPTARLVMKTDPITCRQYPDLEPCVLTESYRHRPSGKTIKVHRRRGYGRCAFDMIESPLGVFFYRGDSEGEGGSGYHWLRRQSLQEVLSKLISGGLLVTDGSQHDSRKYKELWKYHNANVGREAMDSVKAFSRDGCSFACVGYAGKRYGPTLIWQVRKLI